MPGPLTRDQITSLWRSVTDPGYHEPLLGNPESGLEVVTQAHEQLARASEMIDRTTQASFILPWSGQTDEPAAGASYATVDLTLARTRHPTTPLTIPAGTVVLHVITEPGEEGGVEYVTSRRYLLTEDAVFGVGEMGPLTVEAVAERPGYAHNLPLPGTLSRLEQPGSGLANGDAEVLAGGACVVELDDSSDQLTPFQVGQTVELLSGPDAGQRRRMTAWLGGAPPQVSLARTGIYNVSATSGTFIRGETLSQFAIPPKLHTFVSLTHNKLVGIDVRSTPAAFGVGTVTGLTSGAAATIVGVEQSPRLTAATGVAWRVLDWGDDFGVTVTNAASPSRGKSPMLDELGWERGMGRSSGETDSAYRSRVGYPADTVSPNAIRRACNKILEPLGQSVCLREVGTSKLPGLFFDAGASVDVPQDPEHNFAFDMDPALRPQDTWKVLLSYLEFRAFFLIGVPLLPAGSEETYQAIYNEVDRIRGGGVGFVMVIENLGCI